MGLEYSGKTYKYLDQCAGDFYNVKKCLTYNRPVIVVTGSRSLGKSTAIACYALIDFLENGHKFMYVRRRQRDTFKTCKTFFENAVTIINTKTKFKITAFKYYKGKYLISTGMNEEDEENFEVCGMACPLSEEEELKSSVFSDYFTIIYDEFISKDPNKYLGTKDNIDVEWNTLMSLYQTIDRGVDRPFRDETRVFLLGNKSTIYNPICLSLGISDYVAQGAHFVAPKGKLWVWEDVKGVKATETIQESFAFRLSSDKVQKYAYENQGADSTDFIKRPGIANYSKTVRLRGVNYGIYCDKDFKFYIDRPKPGYEIVSLDVESHNGTDVEMIKKWQESPIMSIISSAYKRGALFFGNGKIQAAFLKYLEFMP